MPIAPTTQTRQLARRGRGRRIAERRIVLVRLHHRTRRGEMAADARGGVLGRHHHPPRAREQLRGAPAQRRDGDVLVDQVAGIGDAGLALRDRGLAAIALRRANQRDAAAQPGIVMHMHVVWHAETAEQFEHRRMMTDQVVQFDGARALAREQAQQVRQFVRHGVAQVGEGIRGAVADRDAACAIAASGTDAVRWRGTRLRGAARPRPRSGAPRRRRTHG